MIDDKNDETGENEITKPSESEITKPVVHGVLDPASDEAKTLGPTDRMPIEFWAKKNETAEWLFKATRVGKNWPIGQEMTETEFLAGINWAASVTAR